MGGSPDHGADSGEAGGGCDEGEHDADEGRLSKTGSLSLGLAGGREGDSQPARSSLLSSEKGR